MRNSGTSMSSPLVAGIAALYLEKCSKADYNDFKTDLINSAYADGFTGTLPNYGYGYGKAHALNLLLSTNFTSTVSGPPGICADSIDLSISTSSIIDSVVWSDGSVSSVNTTSTPGDYYAFVYDDRGCLSHTDTVSIAQFTVPTIDPITQTGETLSTTASDDYQWTLNGADLPGETNTSLNITPPYGTYTCYTTSADGCIAETDPITVTVGMELLESAGIHLFPNPNDGTFTIGSDMEINNVSLYTNDGRSVPVDRIGNTYDISSFSSGVYSLLITTESHSFVVKITRL